MHRSSQITLMIQLKSEKRLFWNKNALNLKHYKHINTFKHIKLKIINILCENYFMGDTGLS